MKSTVIKEMSQEMLNTPVAEMMKIQEKYSGVPDNVLLDQFTMSIGVSKLWMELAEMRLEILRRMYE